MASPTLCCQKCRTPLKVDISLQDLNPASFKILADAAPVLEPRATDASGSAAARERRQKYDEVLKESSSPAQKRTSATGRRTSNSRLTPDMSYIMLSDSQLGPEGGAEQERTPTKRGRESRKSESMHSGQPLSQQMEMATRLFEILSSRSDIDHPVCAECTDILLDGMQKRQASVIRERDAYVRFLKKAQEDLSTDEEKAKTQRDLEDVQRRETEALKELEALEAEKAKMEDEIAALDAESEALDDEEEDFWRERNAFVAEYTAFQEERDSLQTQLAHDTKLLESLQRRNVYNDTFSIGHDGHFGTINGLRLGRLPDHPVDWAEINAAWGQALLLLVVVSNKLGYTFQDYQLVPVGSTSKIIRLDRQQVSSDGKPKGAVLELFSSGSLPLSLGLFHARIDDAMVAFLDCLNLLGLYVERTSAPSSHTQGLKMPYAIHKDRIGDVSIRLGNFGQDEQWTKACKYTLTCCKFLLAHASHMDDAKTAR